MRALWIGATGLSAGQLKVDTHSHNIANVNTNGFKARQPLFQEALHRQTVRPNRQTDQLPGAEEMVIIGGGTRAAGFSVSQRQGNLEVTGEPWHLALPGPGFFAVSFPGAPDHQAFTRHGAFQPDRNGRIVDAKGRFLLDAAGNPLRIPTDVVEVTVQSDGTVTGRDDRDRPVDIGRLQVALFTNPGGLEHLGDGVYGLTAASGPPRWVRPGREGVSLQAGALESANVDLAAEMVGLITAQRTLQFSARVVQTSDDMMGIVNRLYQ